MNVELAGAADGVLATLPSRKVRPLCSALLLLLFTEFGRLQALLVCPSSLTRGESLSPVIFQSAQHQLHFMHIFAGIVQGDLAGLCEAPKQDSMNCRVEMTVSRGVLRIVGTIIGGTIGFLIMLHYSLAANPYALMA